MLGVPISRVLAACRRASPEQVEPEILELRIHGVNNTRPWQMLEVDEGDAVQVRGDTLGGFWTLSEEARAHAGEVPETHLDHMDAEVRREAYWWGPQARTGSAVPFLGTVAGYLSQAGWLLLLPLGLSNVAYWSRRLAPPGAYGRGAKSIRVFGLLLSFLLTASVSVVALDIVGTQCLVDDDGAVRKECPALPSWLTWLTSYSWSERLVMLSLVPVLVLLFLRWLSTAASVKYERPTSAPVTPEAAGTAGGPGPAERPETDGGPPPVLARDGLWSRWALTRSMAFVHVAGGLALVTVVLAWSRVYLADPVSGASCLSASSYFHDSYCLSTALTGKPWSVAALVASVGVLAWSIAETARSRVDAVPEGRSSRTSVAVLIVAASVFIGHSVVMLLLDVPQPKGATLAGLNTTPGILLAALLGIGLAGLGWRRRAVSWLWYLLALAVVAALGANAFGYRVVLGSFTQTLAVVAGVGLVLLLALSIRSGGSADPHYPAGTGGRGGSGARAGSGRRSGQEPGCRWRHQAWSGAAPGVFLLLAAGAQMLLCALLVVAVGDWLNGAPDASTLAPPPPDADLVAVAPVTIPATYVTFTASMLAGAVLLVLFLLGAIGLMWWLGRDPIPGAALGEPVTELAAPAERDATVNRPAGRLGELERRPDLCQAVVRGRRLAGLAHRAELVAGVVAAGLAAALAGTIIWATDGRLPSGVVNAGLLAMALLWTSTVLRVITAGSATGRPIALIWDLMCFLPRSAHPFGPPCYAERAVPEIAARMDAWLRGDDLPTPAGHRSERERRAVARRRVVLSAHSLGAVLAVAALFTHDGVAEPREPATSGPDRGCGKPSRSAGPPSSARPAAAGQGRTGRIALLTYGTQLRAYFGRMFPELLGPAVLGTSGVDPAQVAASDPWWRDLRSAAGVSCEPVPATSATSCVVGILGGADTDRRPAWVSLWRRTDYLGFPVASYRGNLIDRAAEEIDATAYVATVATHGGYPRAPGYGRAFREVLGRLGDPAP